MLTCPVCRAENSQGPNCRRCKADLSMLFALETEREGHLALIGKAVAESRWEDALAHLDEVAQIRDDDKVPPMRSALLLLAGKFQQALQIHSSLVRQ